MSKVSVVNLLNTIGNLYSDDRIGSAIASTLRELVEESEVKDWNGEEPLRRNHRVKQECSESVHIIEAVSENQVVLRHSVKLGLMACNIDLIQPIKTKLERLYDEWISIPRSVPPTPGSTLDECLRYDKERYLSFTQYVLDHHEGDKRD